MRIHTLWKQWDDDEVELIFALDDGTLSENYAAWEEGCEAALTRYGIQPEDTRHLIVEFPGAAIYNAFEVPWSRGIVVLPKEN
jgi:hypothetical protein